MEAGPVAPALLFSQARLQADLSAWEQVLLVEMSKGARNREIAPTEVMSEMAGQLSLM